MKDWYVYQADGNHIGPVSAELLARGILAGKVPRDAHIGAMGDPSWSAILDVAEIQQAVTSLQKSDDKPMRAGMNSVPPAPPPPPHSSPTLDGVGAVDQMRAAQVLAAARTSNPVPAPVPTKAGLVPSTPRVAAGLAPTAPRVPSTPAPAPVAPTPAPVAAAPAPAPAPAPVPVPVPVPVPAPAPVAAAPMPVPAPVTDSAAPPAPATDSVAPPAIPAAAPVPAEAKQEEKKKKDDKKEEKKADEKKDEKKEEKKDDKKKEEPKAPVLPRSYRFIPIGIFGIFFFLSLLVVGISFALRSPQATEEADDLAAPSATGTAATAAPHK